jgi:hypothetical protein
VWFVCTEASTRIAGKKYSQQPQTGKQQMGNQLLMFGDIRATGLQLYREGIIVMVPGEIQIGR